MSKEFSRRLAIVVGGLIGVSTLILVFLVRESHGPATASRDQIVREEKSLMGTIWLLQLSIGTDESDVKARTALQDVFAELSRIENLMSEWKKDSPVSSINAAAGEKLVPVPAELRLLIERALAFGEVTEGAFDITWKGMAHLWDFGESFQVPSGEAIQAALNRVDFRKVEIDGDRVGLSQTGMALGLGGIAKGYAIDRAAWVLRKRGFENFLINGGGDVLTAGARAGQPWKIGVRAPRGRNNQLVARLQLSGGAVVTSGDYERFKIVDGVRYHHIIDPRIGQPANASQSVTVVAPSAEEADVLATAVFVLGPAKGLDLISQRSDTQAFLIDASGKFWMTDGFSQLAEFY
jgi:thiamine biosynthesis lipoprotein